MQGHCQRIAASKNADNGNGRAVRNVVERAVRSQALRVVQRRKEDPASVPASELSTLTHEDFEFPP